MSTGINVAKQIKVLDEGSLLTSDVSQINFTGGVTATTSGNNVTVNVPAAGITVGTTPITSGTDGRVFFQAGGVIQQDAGFLWDTTNKRMQLLGTGVIAAPAANSVLEIKAKNGLSDIAFRVRDSADTKNILAISGNDTINYLNGASGGIAITRTDGYNSARITMSDVFGQQVYIDGVGKIIATANIKAGNTGNGYIGLVTTTGQDRYLKFVNIFGDESLSIGGNNYDGYATMHIKGSPSYDANLIRVSKSDNTNNFVVSDRANVALGGTTFGTSARHVLAQYIGVAPTTSPADSFQQYSADIVAGNAAPHFRTEAGNIIKLYQQSSAGIATVGDLVLVLQNLGLLS